MSPNVACQNILVLGFEAEFARRTARVRAATGKPEWCIPTARIKWSEVNAVAKRLEIDLGPSVAIPTWFPVLRDWDHWTTRIDGLSDAELRRMIAHAEKSIGCDFSWSG